MTRLFLFALFLALASGAAAQTDDVLYDDAFEIDVAAGDAPEVTVDPGTRALLDVLASDEKGSALLRLALRAMMTSAQPLDGPVEIMQPLDRAALRSEFVSFEVSGTASGAATDFLVDLSGAESLGSLSASSTAEGDTRVNARFGFESVEAWATWRALPETEALLAQLSGDPVGVQTELSVTRVGR